MRSDGYRFSNYRPYHNGNIHEKWISPDAWHRLCAGMTCRNAKIRAKEKALPFDIDVDYLLSIFPSDGLCPALKIPLEWGGDTDNSPALDRVDPARGYVRGNVQFLSGIANRIKSNATTEQIVSVANYLKGLD